MDITGPYPLTTRDNKYLLTFIDHFIKYVEAYPLTDQTAESCARISATQILTRHRSGSKLIADQGRAFISSSFSGNLQTFRHTHIAYFKLPLPSKRPD